MPAEEQSQDPSNKEETFENNTIITDKSSKDEHSSKKNCTIDSAVVRSAFEMDETNGNRANQSNFCTYLKLKKTAIFMWTEIFLLIFICIAVAGGFSIPIIIYALDSDRGDNKGTILNGFDLDLNSCPVLKTDVEVW